MLKAVAKSSKTIAIDGLNSLPKNGGRCSEESNARQQLVYYRPVWHRQNLFVAITISSTFLTCQLKHITTIYIYMCVYEDSLDE